MTLVARETPLEFFRAVLGQAMEQERVTVDVETEYYLTRLLLSQIENGFHPDETLGDRFARARNAPSHTRVREYRAIGDRALVFSGLWWERQYRPRRPSHARFHIDIGKVAYRGIGGHPFSELSVKFERVVDSLARFGTDVSLVNARDLLRLYSLWEETQSAHAARVLAGRGIMVMQARNSTPS